MNKYHVIIPTNLKPSPARYEISAASLLAEHFKSDVVFIVRSNYKTPDFLINGQQWELKSPTGSGKRNIERQLQSGSKQSQHIIFDARRSNIPIVRIRYELQRQFHLDKSITRIILIDKSKRVIELSR